MSFLKSSEIGIRSMVVYRARRLGIKPLEYSKEYREWIYSVEDADRILSYRKYRIKEHDIKYYDILEAILFSDSMRDNPEIAARTYNIRLSKIVNMLKDYHDHKHFITPSKMNKNSLDL